MLISSANGNIGRVVKHMSIAKSIKEASVSFINSCSRYERPGSGEPRLDDMQRRWIEVWGASYAKN